MKLKLLSFVLVTTLIVSAALPVQSQGLRATPQLGSLGLGRTADTAQRPADFIVAVVNHEPITNNEVRNRMLRAEQQLAQQGAALPPREEFQKVVLERLISERAQLHLARENGIRIEESAVDQAELNVARQNQLEVAELRKRVVQDGLAVVTFRAELRNQLLLTRLREREVEQRVRVSEQEIDDFVREQQGSTDIAAMEINLAQVLVAAPRRRHANADERAGGARKAHT